MYRKFTFLFITLVMVSLVITPVGKAIAQVETQVSAPDCLPFDPALSQDQNFLQSLPPECVKVHRTLTQDAGTQASAQEVLPIADDTGSKYKSELSGLAAPYTLYLPLVMKDFRGGISGQVTYNGNPIGGIPIELRLAIYPSSTSIRTTITQADGFYQFTDAPSLGSGQYYVRYYNQDNPVYVDYCSGSILNSYTAGNAVAGGSFDIANIPLVFPPDGATVALPYTFQWTPRTGVPSDNYLFDIWDKNNSSVGWFSSKLGYVSQYTLNSLPSSLSLATPYFWDVVVFGSNSTCISSVRTVTFH